VIRPRVQFVTVLAAAVLLVTACGGGPATTPPLSATSAPSGMGASPAASVEPLSPAQVSADSAALDALEKLAHDVPNEPHDTVKAPDGSAELLIPSGALPSGTSAQDVSITRVDPAQAGITEAGNPPIAGWQFSPDGLQFTSPALFLVLNDGQPAGTASAMASLTGDGTVESVPQLSGDGQETTAGQDAWSAAAPVSHFSGLFELKVPNIKLDIPQSEPFRYVGQEFSAHVNFSQDVNGATTMFLIKSLFTANGPLEPSEQEGIPMGLEELPGSELPYVGSDNARLTCTAEGEASFTYTIGVRYLMDVYVKEKEDALELSGTIAPSATSPKFKCLSLETPSPTPPPDTQVPPTAFDVPLQVSAPGASGGDAFFQADGDNTQVTVEVKSFPQLTGPASIRSGTCDSPGPVVYPLIDDISKYQAFELNQPIASLLTGQNVIVVAGHPQGHRHHARSGQHRCALSSDRRVGRELLRLGHGHRPLGALPVHGPAAPGVDQPGRLPGCRHSRLPARRREPGHAPDDNRPQPVRPARGRLLDPGRPGRQRARADGGVRQPSVGVIATGR
jgi:hypothetical protein